MFLLQKHFLWLTPLAFILFFAPWSADIDLTIERYFYVDQHFQTSHLLDLIYIYGVIPGWIMAIGSLILFILSYFYVPLKSWRPYVLLPLLTMIIGAGMIVDKSFKDHWGRPRPKQITEFGGTEAFRPFYKPNFLPQTDPLKSFPSGHCTMGFLFFSLALVGKRMSSRCLFLGGIITTIFLGTLLGYARMAQGGHFFSDVIFSAAIMWWTALFCEWLIFQKLIMHESLNKKTA